MKVHFYVNNLDVSEWISEVSSNISFEENKLIGNTPSKEISLHADNREGKFNHLLDFPFLMKNENDELLGCFYAMEKPERMTSELNLTLYDTMVLTNTDYMSELTYPAYVSEILDEIRQITQIELDTALLPQTLLNRQVNFYDSSETIRTHLGWIAEAGCCNVMANHEGRLKFYPLSKNICYSVNPSDIEQFDKIEAYTVSGIRFDNGLTPIMSGDESGNVYLLDETNPYIDKQSDVELINQAIAGMSFTSCKDIRMAAIDELQCGELVSHADYFVFLPMSIQTNYLNARYDIQEISGEMSTKNCSKTNVIHSDKNKIRRIKSTLDQNANRLNVLAQDVDENTSKIGNLELTAEEFKTEITNIKTEVDTSVAVTEVKAEYGLSDNEETSPVEWSDAIPEEIENGKCLWMRDAVTYTNGIVMYLNLRMMSMQTPDKRIASVMPYYIVTDSDTVVPSSGWQEEQPEWTFNLFLWQKERVSYSDNSFKETSPRCTPMKMKLEDMDAQLNSLVIEMSTVLKQVADGVVQISQKTVDSLNKSIEKWARFNGAELELGMTNSQFKAILSNSELAFWQGNTKVAWLSNNNLYIESAVIGKSLGVGNLRLIDDATGGFSFIVVD